MSVERWQNPSEQSASAAWAASLALETSLVRDDIDITVESGSAMERQLVDAWKEIPSEYYGDLFAAWNVQDGYSTDGYKDLSYYGWTIWNETYYKGQADLVIGDSAELAALRSVLPNVVGFYDGHGHLKRMRPSVAERLRYFKGHVIQRLGMLGMAASGVAMAVTEAGAVADGFGVASATAVGVGTALRTTRKPKQRAERIITTIKESVNNFGADPHTITVPNVYVEKPKDISTLENGLMGTFSFLTPRYGRRNKDDPKKVEVVRLALAMLAQDADPRGLWHTMLHDELSQWQSLHEVVKEASQRVQEAEKRRSYTGVEQVAGEIKALKQRETAAQQAFTAAVATTVSRYNVRFAEQQQSKYEDKMLGAYRAALEQAIATPNNELTHANTETLRVFRDILFDATRQVSAEDEASVKQLRSMCQYIIGIAEHMTDSSQAEQFYTGLINRSGTRIALPAWADVEPLFTRASFYED